MTPHHHIRRQRWQLSASDRTRALELRLCLRQELDALNSIFERTLNAADTTAEVVHIPRLQIHLRINNSDELAGHLETALSAQLAAHLGELSQPNQQGGAGTKPEPQLHRRNLLDFLQHGQLPWHALSADAPGLSHTLAAELESWLAAPEAAWAALYVAAPTSLSAAVPFFLRLLNLLPPATQARLIHAAERNTPAAADAIAYAAKMRPLRQLETQTLGNYRRRYLQALRLATLANAASSTSDDLIAQIQRDLGPTALQQPDRFYAQYKAESNPLAAAPVRLKLPERLPAKPNATAKPPLTPPATQAPTPASLPPVIASLLDTEREKAPGLRVHMAGLALLHAYLPRFLDACRIELDAQERIASHCLPRAAALLHRLATGREEIHEFELGMVKPLLGLSPETPLAVAPGLLDTTDAEECSTLLSAAIAHWSALRSTSSDALRISFLQRQGLLHDNGKHWQLHVESEAFDVLLAQLPWGISLIKLPWMTKPIFTDWPTR